MQYSSLAAKSRGPSRYDRLTGVAVTSARPPILLEVSYESGGCLSFFLSNDLAHRSTFWGFFTSHISFSKLRTIITPWRWCRVFTRSWESQNPPSWDSRKDVHVMKDSKAGLSPRVILVICNQCFFFTFPRFEKKIKHPKKNRLSGEPTHPTHYSVSKSFHPSGEHQP